MFLTDRKRYIAMQKEVWKDFYNIIGTNYSGIEDGSLSNKISFQYNATTNNISISGIKNGATIILFDMNGKNVLTKSILDEEFTSIATLPSGTYIIKVSTGDEIFTTKFLK